MRSSVIGCERRGGGGGEFVMVLVCLVGFFLPILCE